jgi:hypothetical protein
VLPNKIKEHHGGREDDRTNCHRVMLDELLCKGKARASN